jgi:hypothetical protein
VSQGGDSLVSAGAKLCRFLTPAALALFGPACSDAAAPEATYIAP